MAIYSKQVKKAKTPNPNDKDDHHKKLIDYIKNCLDEQYSKEKIVSMLRHYGYEDSIILNAVIKAEQEQNTYLAAQVKKKVDSGDILSDELIEEDTQIVQAEEKEIKRMLAITGSVLIILSGFFAFIFVLQLFK